VILLLNKPVIAQDLRKWTAALLISSLFVSAHAQHPYYLKSNQESALLGSAFVIGGTAYYLRLKAKPPTIDEIGKLDASTINNLDRLATRYYNTSAAQNSDFIFYSVAAISTITTVGTALQSKNNHKNLFTNSVIFFEANLLNIGLTELTKNTSKRLRPYTYNPNVNQSEKLTTDARRSFFSGHTSVVATNSFLTAHLVSNYIEIEKKWLIWVPAALLPAYTGFERVRAGKHFISDVVVGYAIGMSCGLVIPQIHKSKENFTLNASHYSDTTLIGFSYRF
jgi:membrane-associated phospholipid phosphatase